jgi:hypothetical protein
MDNMILSKCGYRCDLCLAYAPNVEKNDRRIELSDGWFRIYGFRIDPDSIVCEGCVSSDSPNVIDKECPVRPCVVSRKIENCAYCDEFVCEKHKQRGVSREDVENRLGRRTDETEYELFIRPYESERRLRSIQTET